MTTIRCPQCGREIADPVPEFCPNPDCGYPLSFAKPDEPDEPEPAMERRPLEKVEPPVVSPAPPVTPPVPTAPVPAPVPPPPPRGPAANPGLLIGIAVAVAVVIGIVVAFAGGGGEDDAAPVETAATPDVRETRGGDAATAEPEDVLAFTRVAHDEEVFGGDGDQMMHRVVAGDGQLVAVGREGLPGSYDAALWTSSDGETWRQVDADPLVVGGDGEQEMTAITHTPEGYVIVGYERTSLDENAAVWLYDGAVVTRVDPAQPALGGPGMQAMTRVIAFEGRILAVGTDGRDDPAAPDAGVWESIDGTSWARVTSEHFGGEDHQFMRTITPFGDGYVGAGDEESDSGFDAAVWKSTGASFDRVLGTGETFGGAGDQQIFSVTTFGKTLVAVGAAAGAAGVDATVWISDDGVAWERISDAAVMGGPRYQTMFGAAAAGEVLVAVGFDTAAGEREDAAIWESADLRTWRRSSIDASGGPGEQRLRAVTVFEGAVVAVGWDGSGGDLDGAVWTAPLPE
jgi:hypothetical protein